MKGYINGFDWLNVSPMKYWSFTAATSPEKRKETVRNAIFSGEYIGARKVDGYYQRVLKDEDGNVFMIARNLNVNGEIIDKHEWVPHLNEWFDALPNGTCLLCECYWPGNEGSRNITSVLGCLKEKAIARQKDTPLHLYVFDVMAWNGQNFDKTRYIDRAQHVCTIAAERPSPYVEYAEFYEGQELWQHIQNYLADGYEGAVIMRKDAVVYDKRTPARVSIKIKKELQDTVDVIIMGANAPAREYTGKDIENWIYWEEVATGKKLKGKLYHDYYDGALIEPVTKTYWNGWAGSVVIGVRKDNEVVPIGSLSGLTDEVLQNWHDYVGKVCEITAMEVMDKGLRHPRFLNWRPDLKPADTDYYRIFKA